jgi:hypothetical protein
MVIFLMGIFSLRVKTARRKRTRDEEKSGKRRPQQPAQLLLPPPGANPLDEDHNNAKMAVLLW